MNSVLLKSEKTDWETPIDFFKKLDEIFNFTLDPCSDEKNYKCKKYYTEKENGLLQSWKNETVFINPPYNKFQIEWILKATQEEIESNCISVLLIPARPDTKVWQDVIFLNASAVCFVKGRLKFGGVQNSAPFPSAIVVFGDIKLSQKQKLEKFGKVI